MVTVGGVRRLTGVRKAMIDLARFFKTPPLAQLDASLREFVARRFQPVLAAAEYLVPGTRGDHEDRNARALAYPGGSATDEQLQAASKAVALEDLLDLYRRTVLGIAHEIDTPTQSAGDSVRFLRDAYAMLHTVLEAYAALLERIARDAPDSPAVEEIDRVLRAADMEYLSQEIPKAIRQSLDGITRVSGIVHAMKGFAHAGGGEKTAVDVNRAIESTVAVTRNEWKHVADLEIDLDPELPLVPGFPGDLNQVLLNVIVNAAHAIAAVRGDAAAGKGTITVSTRRDGPFAEIRVRDSACGIPSEIRPQIFDPFFTTKELGKGTDQGLAMARSIIVDKHGGTIRFDTEVGRGTTFVIHLPIEAAAAEGARAAAAVA